MTTLLQDLRYAWRKLKNAPLFAILVVVTLALGIGANTAVFSVVHGVLWSRLPYPDPEELVFLWETDPTKLERTRGVQTEPGEAQLPRAGGADDRVSPLNFMEWQQESRSFSGLAAFRYWGYTYTGGDEPTDVTTVRVSPNLFDVLEVQPERGRGFVAAEGTPGHERVVVLSHGFWSTRLGADPAAVGRVLELDGESYEVVGVMPPDFEFPADPGVQLWTPLAFEEHELRVRRERILSVVARLAPGVTLGAAQAEMDAIAARMGEAYPDANAGWGARVAPMLNELVGDVRPALLSLLIAVGLILLMACGNIAGVLLARAHARRDEIAIRLSLGAPASRLVRLLLTEALLLSLLGGILGVLAAIWAVEALPALGLEGVPRLHRVSLNVTVLLFATVVAVATALVFGLVPALQAARADVAQTLKERTTGGAGGRRSLTPQRVLVVAQTALAVVLLAGGGLLLRSFLEIQRVSPGFKPDNLLAGRIFLTPSIYPDDHQAVAFFDRLLEELDALPGVVSTGAVTALPLAEGRVGGINYDLPFQVDGQPPWPEGAEPQADFRIASDRYFQTVGIPLLRGRTFARTDGADSPGVMIVNETMSRRFFEGEDPIGKYVTLPVSEEGERYQVIGVVGDVRHYGLDSEPRPEMYLSSRQENHGGLIVVARTTADPKLLGGPLKRVVWSIDPRQPVSDIRTMDDLLAATLAMRKLQAVVLGGFSVLALLLACVGIYGVVAQLVTQRTREIGLRIALGAGSRDVLGMVVRQAAILGATGVVTGLVIALAAARLLEGLLYGVRPRDPLTFVLVPLCLLLVGLLASYVPARRASRIDPVTALRSE